MRYALPVTSRDLLIQQIPSLSEADAAVLLALVQRLRARAEPPAASSSPAAPGREARPNNAPLAGSIRFMGDVESPIDEPWDADG